MKRTLAPVDTLLRGDNKTVASLLDRVKFLKRLDLMVHRRLPAPLSDHASVANYAEDTLILHVDSAAWATQLRFTTPSLMAGLRQERPLRSLRRVVVKVRPQQVTPPLRIHRPQMSTKTSLILNELADSTNNGPLQQALRRLARHGQGSED